MPTPLELKDWKAPWEVKGEDVDADKAKKFAHSLLLREEKALKDATDATTAKAAAEQTASTLQSRVDELSGSADENTRTLQAKVTDLEGKLTAANDAAGKTTERQKLVLQVATDLGLSWRQASKLEGETLEELKTDAEETFGKKPADDGGDDDKDGDAAPVVRPPARLRTPLDPAAGSKAFDPIAAADQIPRP